MTHELIDTKGYDELPASVKQNYSLLQWLWLSDDEKARLIQTECEPEQFKD